MSIQEAISNAFSNLANDSKLYDHWVGVLYTAEGEIIESEWNEANLKMMEDDVMNLTTL